MALYDKRATQTGQPMPVRPKGSRRSEKRVIQAILSGKPQIVRLR